MGLSIYDEHTAYLVTKPIDNTNGVVPVTMVEPTIGALRVDAIIAASFAAADHIIEVVMNGPSDVAFLANVNIPAGAGTGVIPVVDLIPLVAPTATVRPTQRSPAGA